MKTHYQALIQLSLLCSLLFSTQLTQATECGILQLQENKSTRVIVKDNICQHSSSIALGTVFDLSPRGRLWLKSQPSDDTTTPSFQMICQNRSLTNLRLEFSDTTAPWLNQDTLTHCTGWNNNKLSCDGEQNERPGLYCVLAYNNNAKQTMERTTSVKMRSLLSLLNTEETNELINTTELMETIKPDLLLCKNLYQIDDPVKVRWSVNSNKQIEHFFIQVNDKTVNNSFSECAESVVNGFAYPAISQTALFSGTF